MYLNLVVILIYGQVELRDPNLLQIFSCSISIFLSNHVPNNDLYYLVHLAFSISYKL